MKVLLADVRAFVGGVRCALEGVLFAIRSQRNFQIHLAAGAAVGLAAVFLKFNRQEYVLLLLTVSMVFLAELMNTALEFAMDLVEARNHPVVRHAKDIAAGAVLVTVIGSVVVGVLLFGPKLGLVWRGR